LGSLFAFAWGIFYEDEMEGLLYVLLGKALVPQKLPEEVFLTATHDEGSEGFVRLGRASIGEF
jgi:hypothetical protein